MGVGDYNMTVMCFFVWPRHKLCQYLTLKQNTPKLSSKYQTSSVKCLASLSTTSGVAQWLERRAQGPKDRGSNPGRSTRQICELFRVRNVVLTRCRCAQPPRVYKQAQQ